MKYIPIAPTILVAALVPLFGMADKPDVIPITVTDTITNIASASADTGTYQVKADGWLESVYIDLSGHTSPNVDIDIVAAGMLGSRTVFTIDDITTDGVYPVRDLVTTSAGVDIAATPAKYPLVGDLFTVSVYDSDSPTGVNVNVYMVYSDVSSP